MDNANWTVFPPAHYPAEETRHEHSREAIWVACRNGHPDALYSLRIGRHSQVRPRGRKDRRAGLCPAVDRRGPSRTGRGAGGGDRPRDARAAAASTCHGATDAPRRRAAQCPAAFPRDAACRGGGAGTAANRSPSGRSSGGTTNAGIDSSSAATDSSSHRRRGRRRHTKRAGDRRSAGRGTRHPRTGRSGRHASADRTAADTAAAVSGISPR